MAEVSRAAPGPAHFRSMPLEEYARKREFDHTPEPAPEVPLPSGDGHRFCIQRHHARRLHYDLRMEAGGTLKSWAVPEGPTLDPTVKRLAVMVEDHPLLYLTFEGNIPKGNYGAGSMMLWDIGTFEPLGGLSAEAQLERGDFKFRMHGRKITGEFALVRLKNSAKGNEWLLIKKKDASAATPWDIGKLGYSVLTGRTQSEIAADLPAAIASPLPDTMHDLPATSAVRAPMPASITPMLAASSSEPPAGEGWIYEIKWDGVRTIAFLDHGAVRLTGRKGTSFDRQYPEIQALTGCVRAETAILDGEIAALDEAGRPNFSRLQARIMATGPSAVAQLMRSRPVVYFVFDLLYWNGWDLRDAPLVERRRLLASILSPHPHIRFSRDFDDDPARLLEVVRGQGLEGLVAKRASSPYRDTRTPDWVKIKVTHEQEFVIAGFAEGGRDHFGSLVLGAWSEGRLVYVGNVGTGFDNRTIAAIHKLIAPSETGECPFGSVPAMVHPARWVRPEHVCRVRYNSWTEEKRLRAPVFVGLRPDIAPEECLLRMEGASSRPPMLAGARDEAVVDVEGRRLHFTNLNKVFFPREGYNKRDILNYYDAVADLLLPHWKDRPLSLRRYPDGIEGEGFFQKNAATGFPDWMRSELVVDVDREEKRLIVGAGRAELLYLAHLGCIDQNPWMSRVGSLDHPDFILIDLDPSECSYDRIVEAALIVRRKLDLLGLEGFPKTTGGDGMHIYVPLEPVYTYEQSRSFAEILARICAAERPDLFTLPRSLSRRERNRVYFDYMQNARGKTISAPYVLRAYAGAPVATPLEWRELTPALRPAQFHLRNAPDRFARLGDLFAPVLSRPQRLEPAMERLERLLAGPAVPL